MEVGVAGRGRARKNHRHRKAQGMFGKSVMTEAWDAGGGVEGGRVTIKKLKGQ